MTIHASDDLMAWLGPAADDLTPEQIDRLTEVDRAVRVRYPDPDEQAEREAALSATVQYLLGDITPEGADAELRTARRREREAYVAALQVAVMTHRDGVSETASAARCGIDRMGLRRALGKR